MPGNQRGALTCTLHPHPPRDRAHPGHKRPPTDSGWLQAPGTPLTCTRQKLFRLQSRCHTSSHAAAGGGGLWQKREASSQRPPGTKSEGPAEQGCGHPLEDTVRRRKGGIQPLVGGPAGGSLCHSGPPGSPLLTCSAPTWGCRDEHATPGLATRGRQALPHPQPNKPAMRQTEVTPGAVTPRRGSDPQGGQ